MSSPIEQITEPAHGRVLVRHSGTRECARLGVDADVLDDLGDAVDAGRLVEVSDAVEQRQFDTGHFGVAGIALYLTQHAGLIDTCESPWGLIKELETVTTDVEVPQLLRHDNLEDHRRLMR